MNINVIKEALKNEPFIPFALNTSDGKTFTVNHPELAIMTKQGLVIAQPDPHGGLPEYPSTVSYMHVTSLVPLKPEESA